MSNGQNESKISLREALRLSLRGYGYWWKTSPQTLLSMAARAIGEGLTPYVGIYLSALILNEIAGARNPDTLLRLVLIALISAAFLALLNAILKRWENRQISLHWYLWEKFFMEKLFSMDFHSVEDPCTRDLLSQIRQNANWNSWGLGWRLLHVWTMMIKAVMSIAGAATLTVSLFSMSVPENAGGLAVLNSPWVATGVVALMFIVTFIAPLLSAKAESYWTQYTDDAKMGNRYFSFFGMMGYDSARALDIRMYRQDVFCVHMAALGNMFSTKSKIAKFARGPMGGLLAASAAVSQVFTAIVYIFICLKAWGGAFGVGSVTQYIGAITALAGGVSALVSALGDLRNNAPFLRTTFEFLDLPNDMYQGSLTVEKRSDCKYEIEFRNVSFKYPSTDTWALRGVSLKFSVGQRLAVVGMNGSGKTTFIKLLCRLYDPTEGEILLNGIDIRKYDYQEYMSIFSVVFQDFKLLSFGLGENVAASTAVDMAKAERCLRGAGFGDRLAALPKGLNTNLYKDFDEAGVDVSGGEAQKIALARALYKDAAFIILDEPTAALDPIAEFEVYSRMNEIVGKKTAVFISHRLSSCRFCHDIAVFHEGRIIQRGSHDDLVADSSGKYHELWNAQAQYYTDQQEQDCAGDSLAL